MDFTPTKLNDYAILHTVNVERGKIVVAFREGHDVHPFVVAFWHPSLMEGWHHGDYCETLPEAMTAVARRVALAGGEKEPANG